MLKDLKIENIYIVCGHTDMRKSIDGLASIIQQQFQLANWVIKGAKWFEPVIRQLWAYAYLEPVLNHRNGQEKWSGCVWISALSHDCAS